MCEKFQDEILWGYDFIGVEFPIFLPTFVWALQQCTTVPVMFGTDQSAMIPYGRECKQFTCLGIPVLNCLWKSREKHIF